MLISQLKRRIWLRTRSWPNQERRCWRKPQPSHRISWVCWRRNYTVSLQSLVIEGGNPIGFPFFVWSELSDLVFCYLDFHLSFFSLTPQFPLFSFHSENKYLSEFSHDVNSSIFWFFSKVIWMLCRYIGNLVGNWLELNPIWKRRRSDNRVGYL